jgi:bifunctional non-homologous end joining protein LigD
MSVAQRKRNRFHPEAKRAPMPASVEPMRPTLAAKPFSDPAWLFEPKWDGWRTLCFVHDGKLHLVSRRKNSLDERFPELREIRKAIKADAALIDGEIVALGEDGLPQFDALRFRRGRKCAIVLRLRLTAP